MGHTERIILVSALIIGCPSFWAVGIFSAANHFQNQAINRGYAQHNPTTGQWEWIEPEEP